jgi:SH3-like domain-containing protein
MYNMDETGFSIGSIRAAQVVVNKTLKTKYHANPGRQEWTSVLECVSADGKTIPPFIILKGEKISISWIPKSALQLNWHFAASSNGWTIIDLGFE